MFTEALYSAEIAQFEQTWENKIQIEIAQAIDKAHSYSFNSSNYRSSLADNQLQAWDELVQHHQPDSNGHSLDQRYAALLDSPLTDALQHIAQFDPKNAIEADIVREYVAAIAPEELAHYSELMCLDGVFKSGAKYPLVRLKDYLRLNTQKVKPKNQADINYKVLGVSNEIGVFINETLKPEETNQSYYFVEKNQFCYNPYRINVGSIGLNQFDYDNQIISGAYSVFSTDETKLHPVFLLALLKTDHFLAYVNSKANGGVRMNFEFEFLQDWEISLPPIEVQQQIFEKIERQQAIIDGVDKILQNWNLDYFDEFEKKFNPRLIDDLLIDSLYGTSEKSDYGTDGYNVLRLGNIKVCGFDLSDIKRVVLSEKDYEKLRLKKGDFLIVRSNGNPDLVGKCAVWEDNSLDFVYASYLIKFRFNLELANPKFVMYFLSSQSGRTLIKPQAGGGTYNISSTSFKELAIPLPDLPTQNSIVEKLDAEMKTLAQIRKMKTEAQEKITKLINAIWASS